MSAALIRRDYLAARSYRVAFVLDIFYGIMNLLVFLYISRIFQSVATADLQGAENYFDFAAIGLAMTLVIGTASSALARTIREEQLTGTLEALLTQPLTAAELAIGLAGYPFVFAVTRSLAYILVAGAFMGLDLGNTDWVGLLLMLATTGIVLGALGIALGALIVIFKQGQPLVGATTYGLGLLSGALFPVTVLPDWLQRVSDIVPTKIALEGMRMAAFGGADWEARAVTLALITLVIGPLAVVMFRAALSHARRSGTLAQY